MVSLFHRATINNQMMYDGRIPDDEQTDCFVAIVSANTCACLMFNVQ